jgi:alanine dehydrogenase
LRYLDDVMPKNVTTLFSDRHTILESISRADLVIGAVLIPGAKAPKLVTEAMVKTMRPGSVILDVAIDQGGCIETVELTTHDSPIIVKHGVLHYAVPNIPGAVSNTSTYALTNVTLKYARALAKLGFEKAVAQDAALAKGVNIYKGKVVYPAVAEAMGQKASALAALMN